MIAVAVIASAGLAACGSTEPTAADPNVVVRYSFDTIGNHWLPPEQPWRGPGPLLTSTCGDPRSGLSIAPAGIAGSSVSPVQTVAIDDTPEGPLPSPQGPIVRIGAVRYSDDEAATAGVRSITAEALQDCVTRTTHKYLDDRGVNYRSVVRPTASAFTTNAGMNEGISLVQTTFEEEAVGGFDNSRGVNVAVGRSGPLVITVVSSTSSQSPDPGADLQFVQDAVADLLRAEPA